MINKIKDKQTGEYHDIGGLKCKLVASGTLVFNEEENNSYNPICNFEEGKTYFIFIEINGEQVQFSGTIYKNMLRTPFVLDYSSDMLLCLVSDADNRIYIFDNQINWVENLEETPYKVYELPFALEV